MLTKLTNCILFFLLSLFIFFREEENRRGRGGDEGRDIKGGEKRECQIYKTLTFKFVKVKKKKKTKTLSHKWKSYMTKADEKAEFKPAYDSIDIKPFS